MNIASLIRRCRCGKLYGVLSHLLFAGPAPHWSIASYIAHGGGVPAGILPWRSVWKNWNGVASRWWKNVEDIFIHFDRIHERDRQTETAWRHRPRLHSITWQKLRQSSANSSYNKEADEIIGRLSSTWEPTSVTVLVWSEQIPFPSLFLVADIPPTLLHPAALAASPNVDKYPPIFTVECIKLHSITFSLQ